MADGDEQDIAHEVRQSKVIFWQALGLGLLAFFVLAWIEASIPDQSQVQARDRMDKVVDVLHTLSRMGLEAVVIACVIACLSETRLLKNYFEERLKRLVRSSAKQTQDSIRSFTKETQETFSAFTKQTEQSVGEFTSLLTSLSAQISDVIAGTMSTSQEHVSALVGQDFLSRARNPEYIRTIDAQVRAEIEASFQHAWFQRSVPEEMGVLLDRLRGLREALTVWRTDFHFVLKYETSTDYPSHYTIACDNEFVNVNHSGKKEPVEQIVQENCARADGIPTEAYYILHAFDVDGKALAPKVPTQSREDGDRIIFETRFDLPEGDGPVRLRRYSTSLYSTTQPWVSTFYRAVNGFDVTLQHPDDVVPMLYVFGVADPKHPDPDPLKPDVELNTLHKWTYRGWCLPNQGMVMTFAKRSSPKRITAKSSAATSSSPGEAAATNQSNGHPTS